MLALKGETISAIMSPGKESNTAKNNNKSKLLKFISQSLSRSCELGFRYPEKNIEITFDLGQTLNLKYRADLRIKDVDDFSSEFSIGDRIADVVFHVEPHGTNIM